MRNGVEVAGGVLLVVAVVAGCSSAAGPSGAMQNDVSGSLSPSSSSEPSASGPAASVSTQSASAAAMSTEAASAAAMPSVVSSGPAPQPPSEAALGGTYVGPSTVCESGLQYACGDTGPGGGTVFYAVSTQFPCGDGLASRCNFLEVAPNGWNGTEVNCPGGCGGKPNKTSDYGSDGLGDGPGYPACTSNAFVSQGKAVPGASGTAIGSGFANTSAMLGVCNPGDAAEMARIYQGGGMTDWSLPSVDELSALYSYPSRDAIGGFAAGAYWSSTNAGPSWSPPYDNEAYVTYFNKGGGNLQIADWSAGVRPVRAF